MKLSNDEITFIGYGNMGSAIVEGILRDNLFKNIKIVENDKSKFNIKNQNLNFVEKITEQISSSKYIFLCVKPQSFKNLAKQLNNKLSEDQIIISIMAGIKISTIENYLNHYQVVRVMPNTPVSYTHLTLPTKA